MAEVNILDVTRVRDSVENRLVIKVPVELKAEAPERAVRIKPGEDVPGRDGIGNRDSAVPRHKAVVDNKCSNKTRVPVGSRRRLAEVAAAAEKDIADSNSNNNLVLIILGKEEKEVIVTIYD